MHFPSALRVATITNGLINNKSEVYMMPDGHLLEYLAEKLKFQYKVEETTTLKGILKLLMRGNADIGIARLPMVSWILNYVDATVPYYKNDIGFVTEKSGELSKFKAFTYPFSSGVWIFCLLFALAATLMSKCITSSKSSLVKIFLALVGSMLKQPLKIEVSSLEKKIWWTTWLTWAGLMPFLYSALFLSFLTVPAKEPGVKNFEELSDAVVNKIFKCLCDAYTKDFLLSSSEEHLRLLGEEIAKNKWLTPASGLPPISKTEAWIDDKFLLNFVQYRPLNRIKFISEDSLIVYPITVCVRKGFCCMEQLNLAILDALSADLINYFNEIRIKRSRLRKNLRRLAWPEETNHALSMEELQYAFYLLLFGYVLCSIAFLCELLIPERIVRRLMHDSTSRKRRRKARRTSKA